MTHKRDDIDTASSASNHANRINSILACLVPYSQLVDKLTGALSVKPAPSPILSLASFYSSSRLTPGSPLHPRATSIFCSHFFVALLSEAGSAEQVKKKRKFVDTSLSEHAAFIRAARMTMFLLDRKLLWFEARTKKKSIFIGVDWRCVHERATRIKIIFITSHPIHYALLSLSSKKPRRRLKN